MTGSNQRNYFTLENNDICDVGEVQHRDYISFVFLILFLTVLLYKWDEVILIKLQYEVYYRCLIESVFKPLNTV